MNIVHIGLPKAASTTLQNRLFATLRHYAYVGRIDNGYRNERTRELIERLAIQDSVDYDHAGTDALLRSLPEVAAARNKSILVSAESLSVEGRADRRMIAERLHRLFVPAKVLILLRAQPSMLQSMYLNHVRGAGRRVGSFDAWLDETYGGVRFNDLYRVGLNYEPLMRAYDEVFGPDNVVVLPFELIRDQNSIFYSRIAELLDVPIDEVQSCVRHNSDNQRMSERQLLALRLQNRMSAGTNLAMLGRRILPMPLYRKIRGVVVGGRRVEAPPLPERWHVRVAAACAPGNSKIEARIGIPLGGLGYPVQA
ncbi:MAG: hypothetical protein QOF09_597 [Alphaproteobacteria bacterium]|jgi:hypothetical protein|nr:hypothetical protein [Alphaproteobacteria bacterium]